MTLLKYNLCYHRYLGTQSVQALAEHNKVTINWVPGHEGVLGIKKRCFTRKGTEKIISTY